MSQLVAALGVAAQAHERGHDLPARRVRQPDDGALRHRRVEQQRRLDLRRIDPVGAALDDVVAAAVEVDLPALVGVRGVAGRQPAARELALRRRGIVPVAEHAHRVVGGDRDLPRLAGCDRRQRVVEQQPQHGRREEPDRDAALAQDRERALRVEAALAEGDDRDPVRSRAGSSSSTRALCPGCGSRALEWRRVSGRGRRHAFCIHHVSPLAGFRDALPFVTALVELDEGPRMMSFLTGVEPDPAAVAWEMPLEVSFAELDDGRLLPVFRPR